MDGHLPVTILKAIFATSQLGKKQFRGSVVAQEVKNPALSWLWLGSLMWHRFGPWPWNFHMPFGKKKKKELNSLYFQLAHMAFHIFIFIQFLCRIFLWVFTIVFFFIYFIHGQKIHGRGHFIIWRYVWPINIHILCVGISLRIIGN